MNRLIPLRHNYFNYHITLEPVRPGRWRYVVTQRIGHNGVLDTGHVVAEGYTITKLNAWVRGRDVARRRRKRGAWWPNER